MRILAVLGVSALLIVSLAWAATAPAATTTTALASPAATPFACPITQPNGFEPPASANVFGRGNGDYGNGDLWTSLWIWGQGEVRVPADQVGPNGLLGGYGGLKWSWWRGVPGTLTIDGKRLDAPAPPLISSVPGGYGDSGFQVSGIAFPTGGCWEITGHVGGKSLTFVVLVIPPASATPVATP